MKSNSNNKKSQVLKKNKAKQTKNKYITEATESEATNREILECEDQLDKIVIKSKEKKIHDDNESKNEEDMENENGSSDNSIQSIEEKKFDIKLFMLV